MNPYHTLPSVDSLLQDERLRPLPPSLVREAVRGELDAAREAIAAGAHPPARELLLERILGRIASAQRPSLHRVVNATGVILHTNLGRAPIDREIFDGAKAVATGYCNLEYDLATGKRGDRYAHAAAALRELLGCEDTLIVNNNAAAVFLILNTFARGKEAIVSRGELVEIGGNFRIPEVMASSGAKMVEVGTTNKTRLTDYEAAIGEETAMVMKVHKSNYTIEGFSAEVGMEEITGLARERGLVDYYDLGSAYLPDLPWGLGKGEPSLSRILRDPPSLLSFSGDKLFGGVQAGIILGRKPLIDRLKRNQLLRMFRVDKFTLALLERTVLAYRRGEIDKIPALRKLFATPERLRERAETLRKRLPIPAEIVASETYVGGGTMPNRKIPTVVLALEGDARTLEEAFRRSGVIGRIEKERFVLDLRTVEEGDFGQVVEAAKNIVRSEE